MLASLLPGVRDVRTPLTVGYLWLVVLWAWFADSIPRERPSDEGLVARFFDLHDLLGPGATLAALSFVAYLLGVLLTVPMGWAERMADIGHFLSGEAAQTRYEYRRRILESATRVEEQALRLGMSPEQAKGFGDEQDEAIRIGVSDLRPRLLVANQDMHGEFDRLEAEASFRLNLCPPICALGLTTAWQVFWPWGVASGAIIAGLFFRGVTSYTRAVSVVERAVVTGVIEHPIDTMLSKYER